MTFTAHGIGGELSPLYVDVKEARGHQMVFRSQCIYIKCLKRRRMTNDTDANPPRARQSDGHCMQTPSLALNPSPLRQVALYPIMHMATVAPNG